MTDPLEHAASLTRPTATPPTLADVHRVRSQRAAPTAAPPAVPSRWFWIGGGAAAGLAAASMAFLLLPATNDDPLRARGVGVAPELRIDVAVVAADGQTERLGADGRTPLSSQLVFRVRSDVPGELDIIERRDGATTPVFHATVPAGTTTPGGETPLGWTTDHGAGPATYRVRLCPESGGPCAHQDLEVRWQ